MAAANSAIVAGEVTRIEDFCILSPYCTWVSCLHRERHALCEGEACRGSYVSKRDAGPLDAWETAVGASWGPEVDAADFGEEAG